MKPRMSSLVTRPAIPVPWICAMSTLCSFAILRTSGDDRSRIASSVPVCRAAVPSLVAGACAADAACCSGAGATGGACRSEAACCVCCAAGEG